MYNVYVYLYYMQNENEGGSVNGPSIHKDYDDENEVSSYRYLYL